MSQDATVQERVQELTWALVDEQINSDEIRLLENLLLSDDQARGTYLNCMQLHTDLRMHFAKPEPVGADGKTPILGFLGGGVPPMDSLTAPQ